jgi:hypothetical protein
MRERRDRDRFDDGDDRARGDHHREHRDREHGMEQRRDRERGRDHRELRERGDRVRREREREKAADSDRKNASKGWSPPPWDSSPLHPSQAKTRNPYAARASKLRR